MFHKSSAASLETPSVQAKPTTLWGFPRRPAQDKAATAAAAPSEDAAFAPDAAMDGFEKFGRAGLDLGGLYRDQQWVGTWGGRC